MTHHWLHQSSVINYPENSGTPTVWEIHLSFRSDSKEGKDRIVMLEITASLKRATDWKEPRLTAVDLVPVSWQNIDMLYKRILRRGQASPEKKRDTKRTNTRATRRNTPNHRAMLLLLLPPPTKWLGISLYTEGLYPQMSLKSLICW